MTKRHQLDITVICILVLSSSGCMPTSMIVPTATGAKSVTVKVRDIDTKLPIWDAKVDLSFRVAAERVFPNECSGYIDGMTDREGMVAFKIEANKCPKNHILSEPVIDSSVSAPGYAYHSKEKEEVFLEKIGFQEISLPLDISFPPVEIDFNRYQANFAILNRRNSLKPGDKFPEFKKNWIEEYAHTGASGHFDEFQSYIGWLSTYSSLPFLRDILDRKYPLPKKTVIFKQNESWLASEYLYEEGRNAVSHAFRNINDDRLVSLLRRVVDIPERQQQFLADAGVPISTEDYWDYLDKRYISNSSLYGKRPNPAVFIMTKLKHDLSPGEYVKRLLQLYSLQLEIELQKGILSNSSEYTDSQRIRDEFLMIESPLVAKQIISELPVIKPGPRPVARKYMEYLYRHGFRSELVRLLQKNEALISAYLVEDQMNSHTCDDKSKCYEYSIEDCLIPKMPEVTAKIKIELEKRLKQTVKNASTNRWIIRNLALINPNEAETLAFRMYGDKSLDLQAKQQLLEGAGEGKVTALCKPVAEEMKISNQMKRDFFTLGYYKIKYLKDSCPGEFLNQVNSFDAKLLRESMNDGSKFDLMHGYSNNDYNFSVWSAITKFFPEDRANDILNDYYRNNEEVIKTIYGYNGFGYCNYLCKRFQKDLPTMNKSYVYKVNDFLNKCAPEKAAEHARMKMGDEELSLNDRTYRGFEIVTQNAGRNNLTNIFMPSTKFVAFFKGSQPDKSLAENIDWSHGLNAESALPHIKKGIYSENTFVRQAAFYAASYYAKEMDEELLRTLRSTAAGNKYPENLFAAYALSLRSGEPVTTEAAARIGNELLTRLQERRYSRTPQFAFASMLTLELASVAGNEQIYRNLLDFVLQPEAMGRYDNFRNDYANYETFRQDLARIIEQTPFSADNLITARLGSNRSLNIVIACKLAEMKSVIIDKKRLEELLEHDDSNVRRAAAEYISSRKDIFPEFQRQMQINSNRWVRKLTEPSK